MGHAVKKKQEDKREVHLFDGEVEPEMPDLDKNNKTILGIDTNDNQVRDDIEVWINRTGKNFNERKAMMQLARSEYEYFIGVNNYTSKIWNGKSHKEDLLSKIENARACVGFIFYYPEYYVHDHIIDKIKSFSRNTSLRKEASWDYYNNSSFVLSVGGFQNDPSFCTFKIEDELRIKESNDLLEKKYTKKHQEKEEIKKKQDDENHRVMQQQHDLIKKSSVEQKPLIKD